MVRILLLCTAWMAMTTLSRAGAGDPESVALANGYAQAFAAMAKSPVTVFYLDAAQTEAIRYVTDISAHAGAVLVRQRGGSRQILDPARIVKITAD